MTEPEFSSLVKEYANPLYRFVRRMVSSDAAAEDIVQDAFVKAWLALDSYDSRKKFSTWLFQIAKNTAIDAIRKRKIPAVSELKREDSDADLMESVVDVAPLPEFNLIKKEQAAAVRAAIDQLPVSMAAVIQLHLEEDLTFAEISPLLGEPVDTIKSRYRRALIKLKPLLAPKSAHKA